MSVRIRPVLLGAVLTLALAGPAVAESPYGIRLAQAAREFGDELGREEREATAEFVFGNALYALLHELGHALASEFRLTLPARREEAVDSFAALALLSLGDDVPDGVVASVAERYALPRRMTIEAMSCGAANALWDAERRRITLCYELAAVDVESLRRDA